jgi:hypothetical protein
VRKTKTFADERIYLNSEAAVLGFEDRDAAITFLESYIGWEFTPSEPEESHEPIEQLEFQVTMMIDFGFGPQTIDLGKIASTCEDDGWREEVQQMANTLGRKYVARNYPDKKWSELSKQVGIMPAPRPA